MSTVSRIALCAVFLVTALSGLALAEEKEAPKMEKMSGKDLFKLTCKGCHTEDSEAGEVTPMSLIIEQWEEFFPEEFVETHKEIAYPQDEKKMVGDILDKEALKKIRKFCIDHAADSEQPMTCG